jgi:PAS domain S-box-containing protein
MAPPDMIEKHIREYAKPHPGTDKILSDYTMTDFFNLKTRDAVFEKTEKEKDETLVFMNNILENIPGMVFIKEAKDLRFTGINKAGEELLGIKREELIGKTDYDFFTEEQAEAFVKQDREVLQSGKLADIPEEPIKTGEGIRYLHTKKVPILDAEGKPKYLLGVSEDITQKKKAEHEIKKTTEKFKLAFENSSDAIVWADPATKKIINLNPAAEELFGWKKSELIGKPNTVLHPPQQEQYYRRDFDRASRSKDIQNTRREITTKDGETKTANIFTSITKVGGKDIIQGIFRDMSRQLETEEELAEAEGKYKKLLENLHDPVIVFNPGENIRYANRSCRGLFGYS